ncbi:MAG: DNA gyrase subunit A [Acidobacteriota bacterium]|nr:DNA gyrase subunit A [Acidobacteriota bacterium]MDH3783889.1 DNA gyrase subunit A [Acidobacteriota bacterium]
METRDNRTTINIEEEMRRSYLDYAMSVIVGRALPDVRDGLKPVHRRVLYAMHETGNTHDKPYRKSARTVGTVIGRFHPHGDSAVYDTIVRLAQDFSMRCPLVDGQGNFGSVDGDRPAAMRYTEIRLQKLAAELLRDIDKETVEFVETYDGSETEPLVLPSAIPNLLVNGSSGIAVGMATNIPPHNLGEVVDGIKALIDNPELSLAELMEIIPGPDFPTAGQIYGTQGIQQAYTTGRGRLRVRGRAEIVPDPRRKNREVILLHELPYQVNKAQLIEDIAGLVRDKRIEGISDIRDESNREGIRVVIELKRDTVAMVMLNQLFKFTKLETTFGVINLALVNGRPQVLDLKTMLRHFIEFRRETIVRRTQFELKKAEARAHILEGLKIAIDNLDEVVSLIRKSKTPPEAKVALMERFEFSTIQAQAILDMRLQRLTGLERQKIIDEYEAVLKLIARLQQILASGTLQFQIVVDELDKVREQFADERRTEIVPRDDEITLEDLIEEEDVVITVTHSGFIKRTALTTYQAQRRGGKGRIGMTTRDEDAVRELFVASTHDFILAFTSFGRVHWLKVHEIPQVQSAGKGKAVVNLIQLQPEEKVAALLSTREFDEDRFVVFATRNGYVKKTPLSAFSRRRAAGIIALTIEDDDALFAADLSTGDLEIFMATAGGKSIRFKETDVRPMGRSARGVIGIRLAKGDRVVAAEVLSGRADILSVSENGYGKRSPVEDYRLQSRGGSGIINMRASDRNGKIVAAMAVCDSDETLAITARGKLIRTSVDGISRMGRNTQGVRVVATNDDDKVVSAIRTAESDAVADPDADTATQEPNEEGAE